MAEPAEFPGHPDRPPPRRETSRESPVAVPGALGPPRWRGQRGRVEVWYATVSGADGTGYWLHHETVAPTRGEPYAHGWAALFPTMGDPSVERFGPEPVRGAEGGAWFQTRAATVRPGRLTGAAGALAWDLELHDPGPPLFTFPRFAWEREVLPGAQVAPLPRAEVRGTFRSGSDGWAVNGSGALARIYGHGSAEHWCWLHADLGGGAVLELVAATPRLTPLRRLPPVPMVQLRLPGEPDWPARPLLAAPCFRAKVGDHRFTVAGSVGRRRLRVDVELPPARCVSLAYTDPDGATATCTNSERADAEVVLARWRGRGGWVEERRWTLAARAHAEIGTRP